MAAAAQPRAPSAHAIGAAQLVAWGATFYAIPPLLPWIGGELAVSTATLSVAMTVGLVLSALGSLAIAAWIQRSGARTPMTTGSVAASLALIGLGVSHHPACAFTALVLLGTAHAALLYEPAFAAVSAHTRDPIARTRAIQVITFWGGWAALWALPATALLERAAGWRVTLLVLATLLAAHTIRIHARLPRQSGAALAPASTPAPPISGHLAVAFGLGAFTTTAMVVNGLLLLRDRELSLATASIVFALLAPLQVFGRLWFMRRNGQLARHDGSLPFVLVAAGIVALLAAPRVHALVLFVILFGAGAGLLTTVRAAVVVARVAPEHAAKQLGAYSFITSMSRALAPAVGAWLHAQIGFELALLALAATALIAAALVWRATACTCAPVPRTCHEAQLGWC